LKSVKRFVKWPKKGINPNKQRTHTIPNIQIGESKVLKSAPTPSI
jgi:hypothetical protein